MPNPKLISIVIPIYNEEKNIELLYKKLIDSAKHLNEFSIEFIMVNDGSADTSWHIIKQLATQDARICALNFTRNFGHQSALMAGYQCAQGDAIISIDADLQHPPETIIEMIEAWRQGYVIVCAQNTHRPDKFFKKIFSQYYYKILNCISDIKMPQDVSDFRLIDRKVLDVLLLNTKNYHYLRGMIAWTGFPCKIIPVVFAPRNHGASGWTWSKLIKFAFDGFTNFSMFPLKIAAYVGLFVMITGVLMLTFITGEALLWKAHYPLFKWLVTIIYIFIGILFILLWILGEYVGRIYETLRERPPYIIQEIITSKKREHHESHGMSARSSAKHFGGLSKNRNTIN